MIEERLGPYEIIESIGSGGRGEVWKARDTRLGRIVAIKKVKEQHSERFKQEARSIAALHHTNICQIHDVGDDYLVLEYVDGKPLSNPLPEQKAVRLAIQIVTSLEEAITVNIQPSSCIPSTTGLNLETFKHERHEMHEKQYQYSCVSCLLCLILCLFCL